MNPIKYIHNGREISTKEAARLEDARMKALTEELKMTRMVQYQKLTQELFAEGMIEIRVAEDRSVLCIDTRTQTALWYLKSDSEEGADGNT